MTKYIYIFAPKTEQNEAVFSQFTTLFPELIEQGREKQEVWSKSPNDVITPSPDPFAPPNIEHKGEIFMMIKAVFSEFAPEMLDNVFEPQTFTDTKEIKDKFWV